MTITGVIPPVVTPRLDSGELDLDGLRSVIGRVLDAGVDGVFVLGSTGEVPYLTDAEREVVVAESVEELRGRVPLYVGINQPSTTRVVDEGRRLLSIGGDVAVVTMPFYADHHPEDTRRHYTAVREGLETPVMAYNIPVRTGGALDSALVAQLAGDQSIAGIKDSSGDDVELRRLILATDHMKDFSVLTGHEVVADGALLAGCHGVVAGLGNVDPVGYVKLYRLATRGEWSAAAREQDRLARLFGITQVAEPALFSPTSRAVGAFKTALKVLGVLTSNTMSEPMRSLGQEEHDQVAGVLRSVMDESSRGE